MARRLAALAGVLGAVLIVLGATAAQAAANWTFAGARDADVRGFAFDPTNPKTVYAAARDDGVWVSRDGGATWARSNTGLDFISAWAVAVDPRRPNIVWAATEVGGAYRSTDFGRTWRHTHAGATDTLADYRLLVPPVPSSTELLRPFLTTGGDPNGIPHQDLAPDKANRGGMWGYVFDQCVSDQEQSGTAEKCAERADWPPGGYDYRDPDIDANTPGAQPGAPYPRTLVRFQFASDIVATSKGALLTAFRGSNNRLGGGAFATEDDGRTWRMMLRDSSGARLVSQSRTGNTAANIWRVRVAPSNPKKWYLASTGGVWRSADGGASWEGGIAHGGVVPHSIDGEIVADTRGLAVNPRNANVVYAGTWGAGVRVTRDGGATWEDSSSGLPARSGIWSLSFDPRDAKHMYAAVYWHGVYESKDAGASWQALNDGFDADTKRQVYAVERASDGAVYAGTINGVWKIPATTAVRGERRNRPLPGTGLGDTVLIIVGAVLVVVAAGVAWSARSR